MGIFGNELLEAAIKNARIAPRASHPNFEYVA
jgi:hypothetical protein